MKSGFFFVLCNVFICAQNIYDGINLKFIRIIV